MTTRLLKNKITKMFEDAFPASSAKEVDLLPRSLVAGKVYEAYILAVIAEALRVRERLILRLKNSNCIQLKSSPGPINRGYPCIEVYRGPDLIGEIWTDVEFLTLSFDRSGGGYPTSGDYHELDIIMTTPGANSRPKHSEVLLGVECKNREYAKEHLKSILGIRRELSLLADPMPTVFAAWPARLVPANPPSCLLTYSTNAGILNYSNPGKVFGIEFIHKDLP